MSGQTAFYRIPAVLIVSVLLAAAMVLSGCDVSARWDLKRAEKALKAADDANAEFWAEKEYRKAQKLFEEAMDLARVRSINKSRDKASEAKDWADEAILWATIRAEEMEKEKASINSKKE